VYPPVREPVKFFSRRSWGLSSDRATAMVAAHVVQVDAVFFGVAVAVGFVSANCRSACSSSWCWYSLTCACILGSAVTPLAAVLFLAGPAAVFVLVGRVPVLPRRTRSLS